MSVPALLPDRLDRYVLRLFATPLMLALAALLFALMLERLLRLFDFVAARGAGFEHAFAMVDNLVPHYLGIALPFAFAIAMFASVSRLGDSSELDVVLSSGRSTVRLVLPFFGAASALVAFNLYLYGFMQPVARYGYHRAYHEAQHTGWDARVENNRFANVGGGFRLSAESSGADGRHLEGVFAQRTLDGVEEIFAARKGVLKPDADGQRLTMTMQGGLMLRIRPAVGYDIGRFTDGTASLDFTPGPPPFRARGESARELTLPELRQRIDGAAAGVHPAEFAGEWHARIARALVPLLLPGWMVPLGMVSKRGRRVSGIVFAALAVFTLNHALQFGESLVESGRAAPFAGIWLPLVVFAAGGIWLFHGSLKRPGDNALTRLLAAIERVLEGFRRTR